MTFGSPLWFWALAVLPVLGWLFLRSEQWRTRALAEFVAPRLRERLVRGGEPGLRVGAAVLALLALAAAILALARPQAGFIEETIPSVGRDILIAVDTSRSMLAPDLQPSRLLRAKLAAEDLIRALPGDRVGLIAFAGSSFLQAPLTGDHDAVLDSLRELDAGIIPRGGTDIGGAIRTALEAFSKAEEGGRALVLFTDGEELDADGATAAREAAAKGVRLFLVGVGTPEGSVIPLPDGGFVKDPSGNVVRSRLDEARLREIAGAASAELFVLNGGPPPADRIAESIRTLAASKAAGGSQRTPVERFQWPLGIAIGLLVAALLMPETGRRRRAPGLTPAAVLMLLGALLPGRAWSATTDPHRAYAEGDYASAWEQFQKRGTEGDPRQQFNAGTAAYKLEKWDAAERAFSEALTSGDSRLKSAAAYNLGNTLVRRAAGQKELPKARGDYEDALRSYDQALALDPASEPARKNRAIAEEMLKQLKAQEPPPKQEQQKQDQSKQDSQSSKDGQSDPKQGKDPQGKDASKDSKPQSSEGDGQQQPAPSSGDGKSPKDEAKAGEPKGEGDSQKDQTGKGGGQAKQDPSGQGEDKTGNEPDKADDAGQGNESQPRPGSSAGEPKDGEPRQGGEPVQPERERTGSVAGGEPTAAEPKAGESMQTAEATEDAQAAEEGRMTPSQAAALLESMRGRDVRIPLIERRRAGSVSKDW